ncbi:arsenate reductase/protein-tyrosine-phosphatase family protein [Microbacterium sp. USHLN186]|uniref:arsenate reductase/protein-tyrosine-phosphatase family protein n=1 Tax=Microbacterium sp. USHLN186 TaxID=3081286 RepID=UPI00301A5872
MIEATQRVLFVCTGNVCRSPYLELRLRATLAQLGRYDIAASSAGLRALVGHPLSRRLALRLQSDGLEAAQHRARQLDQVDVEEADIILTATRDQRRVLSHTFDGVAARTFTAQQFVRLLRSGSPPGSRSLADLVDSANGARGKAGASTDEDDIVDPWRRSRRVYARVGTLMDAVVGELAHYFTQ